MWFNSVHNLFHPSMNLLICCLLGAFLIALAIFLNFISEHLNYFNFLY